MLIRTNQDVWLEWHKIINRGEFCLAGPKKRKNKFACLTDVNPASIQAFHGDIEALSFLAEPVAHWNSAVLKDHCPGGLRVPAHLGGRRGEILSENLTFPAI